MLVLGILLGLTIGFVLTLAFSINKISEDEEKLNIEKNKVKQREVCIDNQLTEIKGLEKIVISLKEDIKALREEVYKTAKRTKKREVISSDQTTK